MINRGDAILVSEADQRAAAARATIRSMTDAARKNFIALVYAAEKDGTLLSRLAVIGFEYLTLTEEDNR